MIVKRGERLFA